MQRRRRGDIELLVDVVRQAASATSPERMLGSLAKAGVVDLGADAAAVLHVESDGRLALRFAHGLPEALIGWKASGDVLDSEAGTELLHACQGEFARAVTLPLVSGGGLFGALVLLFEDAQAPLEARMPLALALADVAALLLGQLSGHAALEKSYDELRASRRALERAEKLRALGQMASGVAHDLKNILNPLGLQLSLLKRRLGKPDDKIAESLDQMSLALKRGDDTIDLLRDFARQSPRRADTLIDLDHVAHEAVRLCMARASTRPAPIALREELGGAPPVPGDAADLLSAIVNLIANAIEALSGGGNVLVRTGSTGTGAFVEVTDDGPGMPPDVEAHAFEPFFTTKGDQGSGLGLAMVYATVERHGGEARLRTAPGAGTTFTISLPGPLSAPPAP